MFILWYESIQLLMHEPKCKLNVLVSLVINHRTAVYLIIGTQISENVVFYKLDLLTIMILISILILKT